MNFATKDEISGKRFVESDWCWGIVLDFEANGDGIFEAKEELIFAWEFKEIWSLKVVFVDEGGEVDLIFRNWGGEDFAEEFELIFLLVNVMDLNKFEFIGLSIGGELDDGLSSYDVCNGDGLVSIAWSDVVKVYDTFFASIKLETGDSFWLIGFKSSEEDFCGGIDDNGWSIHIGGKPSAEGEGSGLIDKHTDTCKLVITDKTLVLAVPGIHKSEITFWHKLI